MVLVLNNNQVNATQLKKDPDKITASENRLYTIDIYGGTGRKSDLLLGANHVFCIQNGQGLNSGDTYKITYYIRIKGKKCNIWKYNATKGKMVKKTEEPIEKKINAKLAYVLSQPDIEIGKKSGEWDVKWSGGYHDVNTDGDHGSNMHEHKYSDIQAEVYGLFPKWLDWYNGDENKKDSKEEYDYITGVATNAGGHGENNWDGDAEDYIEDNKPASIENQANIGNMSKTLYQYNDKYYFKIGPFNNKFSGTYTSCKVYNQNNVPISKLYGKGSGDNFKVYTSINNASKSGKDFYILVPADGTVTRINKVSFTVKATSDEITSHIWILQNADKDAKTQNIISTHSESEGNSTTASVELEGINLVGNLKIKKVDKYNESIKLKDVKFTIKHDTTGKYIKLNNGNISYVENAETIKTDENGEINLSNVLFGNYTVTELENPNEGYEKVQNQTQTKTVTVGTTATFNFTNTRAKINLSGYVWEDLPFNPDKEDEFLELYKGYDKDKNDKLLSNIDVRLIHASDQTKNKTTSTDASGKYKFSDLLIDDLANYHIEFRYNGMCYESITPITDNNKGSKASEGENRTTFNNNYHTISYGKSNQYNLKYSVAENYKSRLLYRADIRTSQYKYGYAGNTKPVSGVDNQFVIVASTENCGYKLDRIISKENILKNNIREIENINLGIKKRKDIDLSLIKDLYSAKVSIKGQEHVYNYADRFNTNTDGKYYSMEPQVKFAQEYGNMSYTRGLYASDIYYDDTNDNNELKVEVTYKIGVKNPSSSLVAVINEITDYYDVKYDNIKVGTGIKDGKIEGENNFIVTSDGTVGTYNKVKIKCNNISLLNDKNSEAEKCIYVQLEVKKDEMVKILDNSDKEVKLDNIAEISSYSVKDKSGNPYAAIDIDSQPENCVPGITGRYEDDTDKAPGLKLVLQEERKVLGTVFVDTPREDLMSEKIRQGDGIYKADEDTKLAGVGVKLTDTAGNIVKVFDPEKRNITDDVYQKGWRDATTITDRNGEYTISGILPDNYQVVYTWGDKDYPVQDYKATIVDEREFAAKNMNLEWYKENVDIRTSDAIDNYDTRKSIDDQTKVITNGVKNMINEAYVEDKGTSIITKMDSTTPNFRVNLEYDSNSTNAVDEYELDDDGQVIINDDGYAVKKPGKENYVRNIDFGIVERARQVLELDKKIKNAKIVLSNGNVLINAEVQEDGTLKDNPKHVVYIPPSIGSNGQLKFEIDSDIVQGARLEIEYGLTVKNNSELDYINENFYHYGNGHGETKEQLVKLNATDVIDYLDNNIATDMSENADWTVISENNDIRKGKFIDTGLLENTDNMKNYLYGTSKIVKTDKLSQVLEPENSKTIGLVGYKLLSVNDETVLENNAEIIQVEKTGGSTLITTPGNYIPGVSASEVDDDISEIVTVIPPTGLETDYISYIILALSSLGVLVAGIILIKKLVLKK